MPAKSNDDPLVGFQFILDVPQLKLTSNIQEVGGFTYEHDVIESKPVGKDGQDSVVKSPGRLKWSELTVKRVATEDMSFFNWRKMVEEGKIQDARCNGSVVAYDYDFTELARWNFKAAWPSKYTMSNFNTANSEAVTEELTIQHHGIVRVK